MKLEMDEPASITAIMVTLIAGVLVMAFLGRGCEQEKARLLGERQRQADCLDHGGQYVSSSCIIMNPPAAKP